MLDSIWRWLKFLSPSNLLLLKKIIDALDALFRLIEELLDNNDNDKPKDK